MCDRVSIPALLANPKRWTRCASSSASEASVPSDHAIGAGAGADGGGDVNASCKNDAEYDLMGIGYLCVAA